MKLTSQSNGISRLHNTTITFQGDNQKDIEQPKVNLHSLSSADKIDFRRDLTAARIELEKKLPKSKSQAEEDGHITNYTINLFSAFYKKIVKLAPAAEKAAIGDWHKLFGSYQKIHSEIIKAKNFGDMPEDAQFELIQGIAKGLKSEHQEVRDGAIELAEAMGMTPDMIQALQSTPSTSR